MSLADRWSNLLKQLRQQGRYRSLHTSTGIDFTSNDYLGYAGGRDHSKSPSPPTPRPGIPGRGVGGEGGDIAIPLMRHGGEGGPSLPRSGVASRLLRGHHDLWDEVETALAHWHGAEAALIFTSGYVANEGLLATIIEPDDWVASDQFNHASIIDGLRLSRAERFIYPHNDLDCLEDGLQKAAQQRQPGRQLFIVTESLFSMDGDVAPLRELTDLASRFDAHVIVDEAHATGCFGPTGAGLVAAAGVRDRVLATVHTGGKALGVLGAYVCGSQQLKELLINRCRQFIFTTALPPVVAQWWLEWLPIVQADEEGRQVLQTNTALFRSQLLEQGVPTPGQHYILPLLLGSDTDATAAAERLQKEGYDIRAIRPPTVPPGTARLRIAIHADHSANMLTQAAQVVADVVKHVREANG